MAAKSVSGGNGKANDAVLQYVGNDWYRLVIHFTPAAGAVAVSSTYYIGAYGVGDVSSNVHLFGPTLHHASELVNPNIFTRFNDPTNSITWSSSGIVFNGNQSDYGGVQICANSSTRKRSFLVRFTVARTAGQVQVRVDGNNYYVGASGDYSFVQEVSDLGGSLGIVQSAAGASKFIGTVSKISIVELEPAPTGNIGLDRGSWGSSSELRLGPTNSFLADLEKELILENTISNSINTTILLKSNSAILPTILSNLTNEIRLASSAFTQAEFSKNISTAILLAANAIFSTSVNSNLTNEIRLASSSSSRIDSISNNIITKILLGAAAVSNTVLESILTNRIELSANIHAAVQQTIGELQTFCVLDNGEEISSVIAMAIVTELFKENRHIKPIEIETNSGSLGAIGPAAKQLIIDQSIAPIKVNTSSHYIKVIKRITQ